MKTTQVTASSEVEKPKRRRLDSRLRMLSAWASASLAPSRLSTGIFPSGSRCMKVTAPLSEAFDAPMPHGSQRRRQSSNWVATGTLPADSTPAIGK